MYQDLIFESAEHVFGEKGFEGATMQEVAAEAGVSLKTVYASYPGKQELYTAIMTERGREMFATVERAHAAAPDPVSQLVEGTRAFVHYLYEHQAWSKIHVRSQISWASRPEGKEAGALWDAGQQAHSTMITDGIASGVFHEDDPAEIALILRALTRVVVMNAIENGEEDADAVADRLVARLLRMLCRERSEIREQEAG